MAISVYERKAEYVAQLDKILDVSQYFDRIDYARDFIGGDEYLRIRNVIGDTFYINVTGNSESAILLEVARFVNGTKPTGYVTGKDARLRASKNFRG